MLPKKGSAAALAAGGAEIVSSVAVAFPVVKSVEVVESARTITPEEAQFSAYKTTRSAQSVARYAGIRAKRAAAKAEEAANKLK